MTLTKTPWDIAQLETAPACFPAPPAQEQEGVKALHFAGPPWQGKPTRVFAYLGLPVGASARNKVPAMVLIHGGGGSAFAHWVKMWNSRGYAAIAMDCCGAYPESAPGKGDRPRHEWAGPPGWGGFEQLDLPVEDQWTYHAVSAAIAAHSLLRAQPEVDSQRVGVTGVSWGGYLTCIVAGLDHRFRFAAPVYGCGFLRKESSWEPRFNELGAAAAQRWISLWDPCQYLPAVQCPMHWINGSNDNHYPLSIWQKSYRLSRGQRSVHVRVGMPHDHPIGEKPAELPVLADQVLRGQGGLPQVMAQGGTHRQTWLNYFGPSPVVRAELCYTSDSMRWQERRWKVESAQHDSASRTVTAILPPETRAYFLNLFDAAGCVVSSEHVVLG